MQPGSNIRQVFERLNLAL